MLHVHIFGSSLSLQEEKEKNEKMGYLDHLSNLCTVSPKKGKHKVMQAVDIKVKMDCDGCERKVRNAVSSMRGVKTVEINRKLSRVTVNGYVKPNKVLKRVKNTGLTRADFWPYVPYDLVYYPYVAQAYDKKAPSGFVKNVPQTLPSPNGTVERLTALFSDENVNACSIM